MSSWEIWPEGPSPRSVALAARRRSRSASRASCAASCSSSVFRRSSISATTPREALPITPRERSDKTTSKDQEHGHATHHTYVRHARQESSLLTYHVGGKCRPEHPREPQWPALPALTATATLTTPTRFCCSFCFCCFYFSNLLPSDTTFQHPAHSHTLHSAPLPTIIQVIDHHHRIAKLRGGWSMTAHHQPRNPIWAAESL